MVWASAGTPARIAVPKIIPIPSHLTQNTGGPKKYRKKSQGLVKILVLNSEQNIKNNSVTLLTKYRFQLVLF